MIVLSTVLLLTVHLLAMNVASAGPLVAAFLLRGAPGEAEATRRAGRRLLRRSAWGLAVGIAGGSALLLFPRDGMRAALARFPADAYWFALTELAFSAACMAALIRRLRGDRRAGWLEFALALATGANLLYHFPPLMAVLGELAADGAWATAETINHKTLLSLWGRAEVQSLWAHFVLASFAVAPLAAVWMPRGVADAQTPPFARLTSRLGLAALTATLLQLPAGVWVLASDGAAAREAMLGGNLAASASFIAGLLAVLALLQSLAGVVWGDGPQAVTKAGWLLIALVLLMTATLRISRAAQSRGGNVESPPRVHGDRPHGSDAAGAGYLAPPSSSGSFCDSSSGPPGSLLALMRSP